MSRFQKLNIEPSLIQALEEQRITRPTEIQERLIPAILNKNDVIGQSQTGTGKTLAFALPVLSNIDTNQNELQAVVVAPTRELAEQIYRVMRTLAERVGEIRVQRAIGGTDKDRAIERLKRVPHILISTPGRLHDLVRQEHAVSVHHVSTLIIDEADQMLDMGFINEIDQVAGQMPDDLQMLVFSATIPEQLRPFLKKYMQAPKHVHVKPDTPSPKGLTHYLIPLKSRSREMLTIEMAQALTPYLCLVFVNTKKEADSLTRLFIEHGIDTETLHGDLSPRERKQAMKKINRADVPFVVCTDLAARGMDIEGVSHVVNVSIPHELEYFQHRAGRTARADLSGEVYTIVDKEDYPALHKLQQQRFFFHYVDLKHGEWKEIEQLGSGYAPGKVRTKSSSSKSSSPTRTPNKKQKNIKPGYKKKMKEEARRRRG
ncbi:LOW QUALITY PROTEIN: ATP-dependent RNA helicase YqfR [Geomicrobium sp. JCM 19039]|nr:LOW QUALITY PROTEIN: ATP-dependent RNA helicase YqfR [Geomicrobium sp. JCM 19039]